MIDLAFDGTAIGAGWYPQEGGARWTGGDAELTLPPASLLHVQVRTGGARV